MLKISPMPFCSHLLSPPSSSGNSSVFYFYSFGFFKRMSYKWSHAACALFSLASLTQHNALQFIHVVVCLTHSAPYTGDAEMGKAQSPPLESSQSNGGGTRAHHHRLLPQYLVHSALPYYLSCSDTPAPQLLCDNPEDRISDLLEVSHWIGESKR